jgi:predicted O-methyltransferase YrrM
MKGKLTNYLKSIGVSAVEGYSQQVAEQVEDLMLLTNKPNINVMEIGFNAGHSAELFLENNKDLYLTSFDLGIHYTVIPAKEYIDRTYSNRHKLILGDSKITLPNFINENKDIKYDIIFIDGGHDYETVKSDMNNCIKLSHKDTIILMDDTYFTGEWVNSGPTKVWTEYLEENKIIELERKQYSLGRGMCWGKIVFDNL